MTLEITLQENENIIQELQQTNERDRQTKKLHSLKYEKQIQFLAIKQKNNETKKQAQTIEDLTLQINNLNQTTRNQARQIKPFIEKNVEVQNEKTNLKRRLNISKNKIRKSLMSINSYTKNACKAKRTHRVRIK